MNKSSPELSSTPAAVAGKSNTIIWMICALQFIYLLDLLLLLPLGPDIAQDLQFPAHYLSWLTAGYALASAAAGLLSLRLLDRWPRKQALLGFFALMLLATLASSCAQQFGMLMLGRVLTGFFAGPTMALAIALVLDLSAPSERGRAMAKVMLSFSIATILGVPLSLQLAHIASWRMPFFVLLVAGALLWLMMWRMAQQNLPDTESNNAPNNAAKVSLMSLLGQSSVRSALLWQALSQFSAFLLIPYFSAYWLLNLAWPREHLAWLYAAGGVVALCVVQILGRWQDRREHGTFYSIIFASAVVVCGIIPLAFPQILPPLLATPFFIALPFICFMAGNAGRNVSMATLSSLVPAPHERAAYMALQNIVQDVAISCAAVLAGNLIWQNQYGKLQGMPSLAILAIFSSGLLLVLLWRHHLKQSRLVLGRI